MNAGIGWKLVRVRARVVVRYQTFPVVLDQVCTHCSKDFGPLLHMDLLQILQVSGLSLCNMDFQLPPKIFYWFQLWRLARPLQDIEMLLTESLRVALPVCFRSLSCWKTKPPPIFNALTEGRRL